MPFSFAGSDAPDAIPIQFVTATTWPEMRRRHGYGGAGVCGCVWFRAQGGAAPFAAWTGADSPVFCSRIDTADKRGRDRFLAGRLPARCPLARTNSSRRGMTLRLAALAFALGSYSFTRYGKPRARSSRSRFPPTRMSKTCRALSKR